MMRIREAVAVEGKYDAIALSSVLDAVIIPVDGFRLFRDGDTMRLLARLAGERGLVVLTDSDAAGFQIRNHIASCLPKDRVKHAYIPAIPGKERRKAAASQEGLLGVEGMPPELLLRALTAAGVTRIEREGAQSSGDTEDSRQEAEGAAGQAYMTPFRLYADGLSGRTNSAALRRALCLQLGLPPRLSASRLRTVLNAAVGEREYLSALRRVTETISSP